MITYFDTSALVPLLVDEPGGGTATELWEASVRVASCRLVLAEGAAALARAARTGRLTGKEHEYAQRGLLELYDELAAVEVTDVLVRRAAHLAVELGLRGYDSVHCAAAVLLAAPQLVVASGNHELLEACTTLGLATASTGPAPPRHSR